MKKVFIGALLLVAVSTYAADSGKSAKSKKGKLVSIDSIFLMQESKEGQLLTEHFQKEVEAFKNNVKEEQQKLVTFQEKLEKQAKILSREAKLEKEEDFLKMKKTAERELADKEEALKIKIQRQQFALRERQMKVANEVFKKRGWGMMIDKNTPGVLFVNNAIDKTSEILKVVDASYKSESVDKKSKPVAIASDSSVDKKVKQA